ncbi:ABC transporter ATP-binding protein [Mycoplasmopsis alligatoris]|uniref:ABC transporter, ATP-binding protein n=1 Tax=Mycoplasmopsis alligatoris A21JP2 TaxID=747682 RepID=D4XVS9_9BACT|nr:ABC transporter ATP-binding protein [Mycoplasmopsis alligatoris]EFF41557.1 ABC transporter, ATP-binding protein [Mycoplasmopsis alligatoris A21JP2]
MIKLLFSLPKRLIPYVILCMFFSLLQPFLLMILPTLLRQFIEMIALDQLKAPNILGLEITMGNLDYLSTLSILTALFTLAFIVTLFIGIRLANYVCINGAYHYRKILFDHLLTLSKLDLDKISHATIITRFSNDISKLRDGLLILIRIMWRSPFFIFWGLVFSLYYSLTLSISIIIMIPLIVLGSIFAIKKIFPLYRKENWKIDELNELSKQDINGISLIKSYNLETRQLNNYIAKNNEFKELTSKVGKLSGISWPIINILVNVGSVLLFLIMAFIIKGFSNDEVSYQASILFQFTSYISFIAAGVFETSFNINGIFRAKAAATRFNDLLNYKSNINFVQNDIKIKNGSIEFKNVTFDYKDLNNKEHFIENLSFYVPSASTYGIIGKTGSGKSTIAHLLTRECLPNQGQILVDNIDINLIDSTNFYNSVSKVYQKPTLLSGSIKSNLTFSTPNANDEEIKKVIDLSCAEFINEYQSQYDYSVAQKGNNLSGGQKQRIAIAQSIIKKPKILILDDATSALDNITDFKVRSNIKEQLKDTTLLIISQRISSIKDSEKIIVLDKGKIVGFDNHKNLLKNNKYYQDIYESQKEVTNEKE